MVLKLSIGKSSTTTDEQKQPEQPAVETKPEFTVKGGLKLRVGTSPKQEKKKLSIGRGDDILHGSGITKKLIDSATKKQEKQVARSFKLNAGTAPKLAPKQNTEQKLTAKLDQKLGGDQSTDKQRGHSKEELVTLDFGTREIDESQLDESQYTALDGMSEQKYACLIGYAGSGKTTVIKLLVNRLKNQVSEIWTDDALTPAQRGKNGNSKVLSIAFVAFTGRAVEQIKKALPKELHSQCTTIHTMLGYAPTTETFYDEELGCYRERKVFRPTFNAAYQLPFDIIIIDEAGMLPVPLGNEVFEAKKAGCRVFMIGDISQLPPVQGRSMLGYAMTKWPTYELKHIHRTALENPVIANAHRILQGKMPIMDGKRVIGFELDNGGLKASHQVEQVVKKLHKRGVFNELQDALLVPQNTTMLGQENLNSKLLTYFNPTVRDEDGVPKNPRIKIKSGNGYAMLAIGDKIMNTQNDKGKGLTNGMTGVITDIQINDRYRSIAAYHADVGALVDDFEMDDIDDLLHESKQKDKEEDNGPAGEQQASHVTTVKWENGRVSTLNTRGQYNQLLHAYAFTVHKSQGGEYDTAVVVMHSANSSMLCRELLYTAWTRAKERVVILYNNKGLMAALKRQRIKGKSLEEKIQRFVEWSSQAGDDEEQPNLPPAQEYAK